jgi:uncharacterized Fe-S cluster-containing radical SAM superfamily protein
MWVSLCKAKNPCGNRLWVLRFTELQVQPLMLLCVDCVPWQHCTHGRYQVDWRCYSHIEDCTDVSKKFLIQLRRISGADDSECPEMAETALHHCTVVLHLKGSTGVANKSIVHEMRIPQVVQV